MTGSADDGRLKYLSRLVQEPLPQLQALLQQKGPHGENLPWVDLIISDIEVIYNHPTTRGKLNELRNPRDSLEDFWRLIKCYPKQWSSIVNMYMEHADDPFQNTKKVVAAAESEPVACSICGKLLANEQLVAGHKWSAHRTRSNIRDLVPDTSK